MNSGPIITTDKVYLNWRKDGAMEVICPASFSIIGVYFWFMEYALKCDISSVASLQQMKVIKSWANAQGKWIPGR